MYLNKIKNSLYTDHKWLMAIIALFFLSVLLYGVSNFQHEKVILYFPDAVEGRVIAEYRTLPRETGRRQRIEQYIEESILGPANIRNYHIFLRDTSVRSVFFPGGGELVVDLDRNAMKRIPGKALTLEQSFKILEDGIKLNFPAVRRVLFLLEGQEPYIPPYTAPAMGE